MSTLSALVVVAMFYVAAISPAPIQLPEVLAMPEPRPEFCPPALAATVIRGC